MVDISQGIFHNPRLGFLIIGGLKKEASPRHVSLIVFGVCGIHVLFFWKGGHSSSLLGDPLTAVTTTRMRHTNRQHIFFFGLCGHGDGESDYFFDYMAFRNTCLLGGGIAEVAKRVGLSNTSTYTSSA